MTTSDAPPNEPPPEGNAPHEPMPEGEEAAPPGTRAMAVVRWVLILLAAAAAAYSVYHYTGLFRSKAVASSSKKYYCPMHPGVVQDHPGTCPICSMDLQEMGGPDGGVTCDAGAPATAATPGPGMAGMPGMPGMAGMPEMPGMVGMPKPTPASATPAGAKDGGVPGMVPITLTPERIQLTGMRTAAVTREKLDGELRTVGVVSADERGLAQVQVRFAGWIDKLLVEQTGQKVKRGELLGTVYSPDLLAPQQELLTALKWKKAPQGVGQDTHLEGLTSGLDTAARGRLQVLGMSKEDIAELESTGKPLRSLRLRSPANGYVVRKNAVEGLYVQPGTELFEIADLSKVWVIADVYEYELSRIAKGQPAHLTLAAYPGQSFDGKVDFLYPTMDPSTRTLRVRIALKNPELVLKPGMYGDVTFQLPGLAALVVPREAVVDSGDEQYLFVAQAGGRFEPRRVKLGQRVGEKVEVVSGVTEGETVVTTANFLIDSESRLRAAIEGTLNKQGATAAAPPGSGPDCETEFDKTKYPDKYDQCRACFVHRGMGTMETDCKEAIQKPWK